MQSLIADFYKIYSVIVNIYLCFGWSAMAGFLGSRRLAVSVTALIRSASHDNIIFQLYL